MDCLATTSHLFSTINTNSAANSKLRAGFHRIYRISTEETLCLSFSRDTYTLGRNVAMKSSRQVSYFKTQQEHGNWEEPDIASDSEQDESLGFGSDGEETETSQTAAVNITAQAEYQRIKKGIFLFLYWTPYVMVSLCGTAPHHYATGLPSAIYDSSHSGR